MNGPIDFEPRLLALRRCMLIASAAFISCVSLFAQKPPSSHDPSIAALSAPKQTTGDNDQADKKLSGFAVVTAVEHTNAGTLYHSDGYRLLIQPDAETKFTDPLKNLADVGEGTWAKFEGVRNEDGTLGVNKVTFSPFGNRKGPKLKSVPKYQLITKDSRIDADGKILDRHQKVRLSDAAGPCGWHKVPGDRVLQERVERIGMSVVPTYQRQLADDDPSRIPFRFYVVDEPKERNVSVCDEGLVLVPKVVVERLQRDDQLASVIALAVACHLKLKMLSSSTLTTVVSDSTALAIVFPPAFVAGFVTFEAIQHRAMNKLERDCARTALQLMADAGYDPWQAPEALRLLSPKRLPKDIGSVSYPSLGQYQLDILKAQYKKPANSSAL